MTILLSNTTLTNPIFSKAERVDIFCLNEMITVVRGPYHLCWTARLIPLWCEGFAVCQCLCLLQRWLQEDGVWPKDPPHLCLCGAESLRNTTVININPTSLSANNTSTSEISRSTQTKYLHPLTICLYTAQDKSLMNMSLGIFMSEKHLFLHCLDIYI